MPTGDCWKCDGQRVGNRVKAGQDDNFMPVFPLGGVASARRGGYREVLSLQYVASKFCDRVSEFLLFPVMKEYWTANPYRECDWCE